MRDRRQWIPAAGLIATIGVALYMVARLYAQADTPAGDFTNASLAEVRDAQGQVILRGNFMVSEEEDDDVERKATLQTTAANQPASGEAEVEFAKESPSRQEIEFSVRNVQPNAALTFVIDGHEVAAATADSRGRVAIEIDVPFRASR